MNGCVQPGGGGEGAPITPKRPCIERSTIELGHACTVHKMQGAEIPVVILVMNRFHDKMLNRRLFYTAVTRAKKKLYIVGDERAIVKAISTDSPVRYGCIERRLK